MDTVRVGKSLRALRHRRGWTQERLAAQSALSRTTISRIETGAIRGISIAAFERVATGLGARLELSVRWNGEGLDRLLDEQHASLVDATVSKLTRLGWEVAAEVSFNVGGERGSIDVLAIHAPTAILLVVEAKSVVPDIQSMLSTLDRKARVGPAIARERGWRPMAVGRLLVVADARTAHRRVARHCATLDVALPERGNSMRAWLAHPSVPAVSGLTFMPIAQGADVRRRAGQRERIRAGRRPAAPGVPRSIQPVGSRARSA